MIQVLLLVNRQGKTRLAKYFTPRNQKERTRIIKDLTQIVLNRTQKLCNFIEWQDYKIVYKRYASLYFITVVDKEDNELIVLDIIHHFVEILDKYFGNVCELDLIFNFHKAYYLLDEYVIAGELQESSKKQILKAVINQDNLMEENKDADKK
mmetsp:Transcript_35830/g.40735  ORF Transcript_35830/g.40735 Transcript_35830/m.40735 type:complete len:152 (+) Transcript_35830:154-609(+)|eukprot:CAMPEP_0115005084 /NCGR_PEP_ID=MMETSP0216-20121206/19642_1 /TAXON_ID=223996 /ORGANISM="Protocruzia adherens, Strain Boccale" /LENGTH=151 /DNA_ID=CAMNT_0002371305 /DNA_START=141 /DNA_END=596 /DNA_ORIENTATION=+